MEPERQIFLYRIDDGNIKLDVRFTDIALWLILNQMAAID